MSGSNNYGKFIQWNTMQHKEEGFPTVHDSMGGPGEHYAK